MLQKFKNNFKSIEDVCLFVRIFVLITLMPVVIRCLSISTLLKLFTPRKKRFAKNLDLEFQIQKIVKFTDYILGRNWWIYKRKCLNRALVLYHFFRKYGFNVQFCMGIRFDQMLSINQGGRKLIGHAWIRYDGRAFMEKQSFEDNKYTETFCFPKMVFSS